MLWYLLLPKNSIVMFDLLTSRSRFEDKSGSGTAQDLSQRTQAGVCGYSEAAVKLDRDFR